MIVKVDCSLKTIFIFYLAHITVYFTIVFTTKWCNNTLELKENLAAEQVDMGKLAVVVVNVVKHRTHFTAELLQHHATNADGLLLYFTKIPLHRMTLLFYSGIDRSAGIQLLRHPPP